MNFLLRTVRQQPLRTALLAAAVTLTVFSALVAAGTLRAADDDGNATVPPYRSYLPNIRHDPTPTATPIPFPQLVNGNFDQGPDVGWTQTPDNLIVRVNSIPAAARTGANSSYVAWLGGEPDIFGLGQKVIIPYDFRDQVRLKLYAFTESEENGCSRDTAGLYETSSTVPLLTFPLCKRLATNAWQQYSVDLLNFGGKQIELVFVANLDGARNSNLFLNRIELCQIGAPGC